MRCSGNNQTTGHVQVMMQVMLVVMMMVHIIVVKLLICAEITLLSMAEFPRHCLGFLKMIIHLLFRLLT